MLLKQPNMNDLLDLARGEHSLEEVAQKAGFSICPTCREVKIDPADIEAIEEIGECLGCNHLRTDLGKEDR
jgi:hypothetical protein